MASVFKTVCKSASFLGKSSAVNDAHAKDSEEQGLGYSAVILAGLEGQILGIKGRCALWGLAYTDDPTVIVFNRLTKWVWQKSSS